MTIEEHNKRYRKYKTEWARKIRALGKDKSLEKVVERMKYWNNKRGISR